MKRSHSDRSPVAHLVSSGGLYGIEHVLLALLPELERLDTHVVLGSLSSSDGAESLLGKAIAELGLSVVYTGYERGFNPLGLAGLDRFLTDWKPAAVHFHGYKATILAGFVALMRQIPAVATYHAEANRVKNFRHLRTMLAVETQILRRLRGIVAVSDPVREELIARGVPQERIWMIPNGVPDRWGGILPLTPRQRSPFDPVLLVVGRLIQEKRVDRAIRVLGRLRGAYPQVKLWIAGAGPLRDTLEAQATNLGVQDAVRFLGHVNEVRVLLRQCDCFIMPSETEGSPMALLEAMAEGVPIVASRVGGIPSAITDGIEGLLTNPGDDDDLFRAVRRVLDDAGLRNNLRTASRRRFLRDYSVELMAARYAEFYDRVLPAQSPASASGTGDLR